MTLNNSQHYLRRKRMEFKDPAVIVDKGSLFSLYFPL